MPRSHKPFQTPLPLDLPPPAREDEMRALFEARWSRWHRCKSYEAAVADPITRRLLELAVVHGACHALPSGRGRR
jgi:hypothetical protein